MSGFEGTPGPWVTADAHGPVDGGDCIQEVSSEHKFFVATCCHYTSREAVKANARLIAAAPELLEELEETHAALCFTPDYIGSERYKRNMAAISKAMGNN